MTSTKRVNLALQGGGSPGAFTWSVLDTGAAGAVSKFNIEPEFLKHLFDLERTAATSWLAATFDSVGVKRSLDIRARFL